ncbi:hypothetical protein [Streptomyces sp. NPDC047976]|uniref:hypothetical protein n=1 Tax=Streptomyces sp. NPDC047976 TaxID=3155746 RepID=UPI0034345158
MGVSSSGLRWQGWAVGMVCLSGLLVFAPLGLYVWASGGPADPSRQASVPPEVRVTACRIDPPSRRVTAVLEARGEGSYVATVEFRDRPPTVPDARESRTLVRLPGLTRDTPATARTEAVGPVWAAGAGVWCGVAGVVGEG